MAMKKSFHYERSQTDEESLLFYIFKVSPFGRNDKRSKRVTQKIRIQSKQPNGNLHYLATRTGRTLYIFLTSSDRSSQCVRP